MKFLIISILTILVVNFTYSQSTEIESYKILNVGSISISSKLEIQSGNYKKYSETFQKEMSKKYGYEISDNRVVFQQKGLNELEKQGLGSFVRVIIETFIQNNGDFEKLTSKLSATNQELSELSKELRNQTQNEFSGTGLKLLKWNGVSITTVNNRSALKISYLRQLNDNPPVVVNIYRFQNNDRMHSLTLSYRQSEEETWKPILENVLSSFKITNVR